MAQASGKCHVLTWFTVGDGKGMCETRRKAPEAQGAAALTHHHLNSEAVQKMGSPVSTS